MYFTIPTFSDIYISEYEKKESFRKPVNGSVDGTVNGFLRFYS